MFLAAVWYNAYATFPRWLCVSTALVCLLLSIGNPNSVLPRNYCSSVLCGLVQRNAAAPAPAPLRPFRNR